MSIRITKLHLILLCTAAMLTVFFFMQLNKDASISLLFDRLFTRTVTVEKIVREIVREDVPPEPAVDPGEVRLHARQVVAIAGEEMKIARRFSRDTAAGQVTLRQAKAVLAEREYGTAVEYALRAIDQFRQAPILLRTSYTVRRGDCLWSIARRADVYGRGSKWVVIWRANEHIIPDFDLIYSRQVLKIPRDNT